MEGSEWKDAGNGKRLTFGELPPVQHADEPPVMRLERYAVSSREGIMRLRTGGAMPLDEKRLDEENVRIYGIIMHEALSRIFVIDDISRAVMQLADSGMILSEETGPLKVKLQTMLSDEAVRKWFDGSMKVLTEATVLLPSGGARRPDRVMIDGDKVILVDYKFGEKEQRHKYQAEDYKRLLNEMGYAHVEACLWYVGKEIIEL